MRQFKIATKKHIYGEEKCKNKYIQLNIKCKLNYKQININRFPWFPVHDNPSQD